MNPIRGTLPSSLCRVKVMASKTYLRAFWFKGGWRGSAVYCIHLHIRDGEIVNVCRSLKRFIKDWSNSWFHFHLFDQQRKCWGFIIISYGTFMPRAWGITRMSEKIIAASRGNLPKNYFKTNRNLTFGWAAGLSHRQALEFGRFWRSRWLHASL